MAPYTWREIYGATYMAPYIWRHIYAAIHMAPHIWRHIYGAINNCWAHDSMPAHHKQKPCSYTYIHTVWRATQSSLA